MDEIFRLDDKKFKKFTIVFKRLMIAALRFGSSKGVQAHISFRIDLEKEEIYPLVFEMQKVNPWGNVYVPLKFIVAHPKLSIKNIFGKGEFKISNIYKTDIKSKKDQLKALSSVVVEKDEENNYYVRLEGLKLPSSPKEESIGWFLNEKQSGKYIANLSERLLTDEKIFTVDNEEVMKSIGTLTLTLGATSIPYKDHKRAEEIKIFASVLTNNCKKIEFVALPLEYMDQKTPVTSVCSVQHYTGSTIILYYRYLDYWNNMEGMVKENKPQEVEGGSSGK